MIKEIVMIVGAEIYKLRRVKSVFIIPAFLIITGAALFYGLGTAVEHNYVGVPGAFYISAASLGWNVRLVALAAVIISAFQISNEFAMGTVKSVWSQPISRRVWFNAKLLFLLVLVFIMAAAALVETLILAAIKYDFSDLTEKEFLVHSSGFLWGRTAASFALTLWSLFAVTAVAASISSLFNRPGSAISVILGGGIVMTALGVFPGLNRYLLTTFITLPLEQLAAVTKGLHPPLTWSDLTLRTIAVPGCYAAVMVLIANAAANRKEINF